LFGAAPVSADSTDDDFIAALEQNGIVVKDRDAAIGTAQAICAGLDRGEPATVLALKLKNDTDLSSGQAGFFVGASVPAYCPQHRDALNEPAPPIAPVPPLLTPAM
jgi:hypothetical protein